MSNTVFLGLGSNLGDREEYLNRALDAIRIGLGEITDISAIYETEPWGFKSVNWFLNMVVRIETEHDADELIGFIKKLEKQIGRKRNYEKYRSREIDIDILLYEDLVIEKLYLRIPHPGIHLRRFILVPLCDVAAGFIHPVLKKSFSTLLEECNDRSQVKKYR